jgi:hypothetical protein
MKKGLLHRRLTSLLSWLLLIILYGCSGYNHIIPANAIPVSDRYYYFVQGKKVMFLVEQVSADNYAFSGRIVMNKAPVSGNKIVIFPCSDKSLEVSGMMLRIPLQDISRVEMLKVSPVNKIVALLGAALVLLFILSSLPSDTGFL